MIENVLVDDKGRVKVPTVLREKVSELLHNEPLILVVEDLRILIGQLFQGKSERSEAWRDVAEFWNRETSTIDEGLLIRASVLSQGQHTNLVEYAVSRKRYPLRNLLDSGYHTSAVDDQYRIQIPVGIPTLREETVTIETPTAGLDIRLFRKEIYELLSKVNQMLLGRGQRTSVFQTPLAMLLDNYRTDSSPREVTPKRGSRFRRSG